MRLADYIVRVVFVGFLVFGLFFLPGVAFGEEGVEPAAVGIAPMALPLVPLIAIPIAIVSLAGIFYGLWLATEHIVGAFLAPILVAFVVGLFLWLMFKILIFFFDRRIYR